MTVESAISSEVEPNQPYTIIVLGGGILDDSEKYNYTDGSGNNIETQTFLSKHSFSRVVAAVESARNLREQGHNVNVVFTGGATNPNRNFSEASAMYGMFLELADPEYKGLWNGFLQIEEEACDTRSNAINVFGVINSETAGNVVVITNGVKSGESENVKQSNLFEGLNQFYSHVWRTFSVFRSVGKRMGFDPKKISVVPAEVILQELGVNFDKKFNTETRAGLMNKAVALWTTFFDYEGRLLSRLTKGRVQEP